MNEHGFTIDEEELILKLVNAEHERVARKNDTWRTRKQRRLAFDVIQKLHLRITERNRVSLSPQQ